MKGLLLFGGLFVVAYGILIPVALGLGGPLLSSLSPKSQFSLDYGDILLTDGIVYAAVIVVTLLPALQAARLRPAEALRGVG